LNTAELRKQAEHLASKKKVDFEKAFDALTPEKSRLLLHELQVHQIELQMQNDELRNIHNQLEISRAQYIDLYDVAPIGYCTLNQDGMLTEANLTAAQLLGVNKNSLINSPVTNFVAKEYQDVYYHFRKQFIRREMNPPAPPTMNDTVELKMKRENAKPFLARLEVRPALIGDKEIHYRLLISDITERKRIEADNLRLEQENQQHQRLESLGTLAAGIAHDFNNLLSGIFGNIELASVAKTNEQRVDYLDTAITAITRARALTGQLLTFAKGGVPVQKIGYLFPFARESAHFALSGSNIACEFDIAENLWPCSFDTNQIGQVIENLIYNAQQAMSEGGEIILSARNVSLRENEIANLPAGNYVRISIRDSGNGIPAELLPRIFDPFFTTKSDGRGLGLATCYSILKRHGGHIAVESDYGNGATFHIYLSAIKDVFVDKPEAETQHSGTSGSIIFMDDDETVRDIAAPILKMLGHEAVLLTNGQEAVDYYRSAVDSGREITALIFDLTIPGVMGGKEAAALIRKFDTAIPIFVCSGYADDPAIANPTAFGFTASMVKPFRIADISALLNKYCSK
jgi:two-component system, cell cycle sensor histidine kinase and response regulator CckA